MIPFSYVISEQGDRHEQPYEPERLDAMEDWYPDAKCSTSPRRSTDGFWSHGQTLADGEEGRRAGGRWVLETELGRIRMELYRLDEPARMNRNTVGPSGGACVEIPERSC